MDDLRKEMDKRLAKMERKVAKIYKEATDDISQKWDDYMERSKRVLQGKEDALASARRSGDAKAVQEAEKALREAKEKQFFRNKEYRDMIDATTDRIAHANQIALDYVNGEMPSVYAYNYNRTAHDVSKEAKKAGIGGISFNMIDEATMKSLITEKRELLPKKMDIPADKRWNKKAINAQVTQGIIQGESVDKIAKRLENVTDMDTKAAVRNARTMTTNAENAGRLDSMKDAEEMGLQYEKIWMASHDDRTRESHALMDGVSVPLDEPFELQNRDGTICKLMYPADPNGDAEQVYNCRCSMVRKLVGYVSPKGKEVEIDAPHYEPTYFDDLQEEAKATTQAEETPETRKAMFEPKKYSATSSDIMERPQRPRRDDFENEDDYYTARAEYREKKAQYEQEKQAVVDAWMNEERQIATAEDYKKWAENAGVRLDDSFLEHVDPKLYDEIARTQQEMFERFPEVKARQDSYYQWENRYSNDHFLMEERAGLSFGPRCADAADFYSEVIEYQKNGYLTKGDGTIQTVVRHEYGHAADGYIRDKFSNLDSTYEDKVSGKTDRRWQAYKDYEKELREITIKYNGGEDAYALTNELEAFAEGFAEYTSNPKSEYGKAFGEFFERWYHASDVE